MGGCCFCTRVDYIFCWCVPKTDVQLNLCCMNEICQLNLLCAPYDAKRWCRFGICHRRLSDHCAGDCAIIAACDLSRRHGYSMDFGVNTENERHERLTFKTTWTYHTCWERGPSIPSFCLRFWEHFQFPSLYFREGAWPFTEWSVGHLTFDDNQVGVKRWMFDDSSIVLQIWSRFTQECHFLRLETQQIVCLYLFIVSPGFLKTLHDQPVVFTCPKSIEYDQIQIDLHILV